MTRPLASPRAWERRVRRAASRVLPRRRTRPEPIFTPAAQRLLAPIPPAAPTDPPGPRVVLLNDCRDQVNYGAEALVDGLLRILHTSIPSATMVPIPSYWLTATADHHGLIGGGSGLVQPRAHYPAVADQFEAVADDWLAGRGGRDAGVVLDRFADADLVVLNGEGSIYRTNQSAIRELFLAWFAQVRLGIPTLFVNGMIHLVDVLPVLPAMVRKTFTALEAVAVREPRSLRNLAAWVPEVPARYFPDSAFVIEPGEARGTPAVADVRARIGSAPYFCFDPGPMPLDAEPGGRSGLHHLLTTLAADGVRPVMVCSAPPDARVEPVAREVGAVYVDTIGDYREYMALAADAQYVVSGRYHNPILAAIMGCPSITLGSANHKVHGACETLDGVIGEPFDGTTLRTGADGIARRARDYVADRDGWAARLQDICERRRSEATGMGQLVRDVLEETR